MLLLDRVLTSTDEVTGVVGASADDVLRAQRLQQTANIVGRTSGQMCWMWWV
jgi:hypothetical protein